MKGRERWTGRCMDLCLGRLFYGCLVSVLVLLIVSGGVEGQSNETVSFVFFQRPPAVTSNTSAAFRWQVVAANGSDPCAAEQCVNQCKLDNAPFQNCSSQVMAYTNLIDGQHVFTVLVSTLRGYFFTNDTSWIVDTVGPTAILTAGASFTNALNLSVGIQFSEPCISPGFQCPSVGLCDVQVRGPGVVVPSTFTVHTFGLQYSLIVALSPSVLKSRVDLKLGRKVCRDAAGNAFNRTASAFFQVHFSHNIPTVNVWTPVQDSQVKVDNEYRTVSATRSLDDLILYVDFSEKMVTTPAQLLSLLQVSQGSLLSLTRGKNNKARNFAFSMTNISEFAIVSISLPANSSFNMYGTPVVETANITFLYDSIRPRVTLSTTSLSKSKNHIVPCLIEFNKPVFVFGADSVTVSGGNLTRFEEVSKSLYALELYVSDGHAVSVVIMENATSDVAGNPNLVSNVLRIRQYSEPAYAVALYSFTSAGLIATALTAGALSVSSATLAAVGALASHTSGSIIADPSRNLLGMATHLQVFALSDWLAASLPVEYRVTTRGLRWLIPHVTLPWEKSSSSPSLNDQSFPAAKSISHSGRQLRVDNGRIFSPRVSVPSPTPAESWRASPVLPCLQPNLQQPDIGCDDNRSLRRRLSRNMTAYGPALGPEEYALYFENTRSNIKVRDVFGQDAYTGWRDFERNMFWVGAVGGVVVVLHWMLLLLLRWKTETSVRGALTVPRFELFLLILALPSLCQAASFIIRGGTTLGIIIGFLVLAIPAAFLLSIILFLVVAILLGSLVQYQEVVVRQQPEQFSEDDAHMSWGSKVMEVLAGPNSVAKWVRKDGLAPAFFPRYGLCFEDRKGPPKLVTLYGEVGGSFPNWINGRDRMKAVHSEDEGEEGVSAVKRLIGGAKAAYIAVDISRRIVLGVIFGAFPRSDKSWIQVSIALSVTAVQLLYLFMFKPYIRRGVQVVESISLSCETGLFVIVLVLLRQDNPSNDHLGAGILMLALLLFSFVSQLVNEWYALMKQLLRLSPTQDRSLKEGFKMLGMGLVLPFVPRGRWGKFISPQPPEPPRAGLIAVNPPSPERLDLDLPDLPEQGRQSTSIHTGSPLMAFGPEPAIPGYDPGSPAFVDPRNAVTEEAVISGEIKADFPAGAINTNYNMPPTSWGSQWSTSRSMEGKRSTKGVNLDYKSSEMKMLRDIAKASFPRWRKRKETSDPGLQISPPVPSNGGIGSGRGAPNLTSSAPSRVGDAAGVQEYSNDISGNDSSDGERYGRSLQPHLVGESSIDHFAGGPSRGVTPHSSSSFEKDSKGSGPLETLSGSSLPIRELVQER